MNLAQLRQEVLDHGFDPSVFNARINQYLNDAQSLVYRRVDYYLDESVQDFWTDASTTAYVVASDVARIRSLREMNGKFELQSSGVRDFDRSANATGMPRAYALDAPFGTPTLYLYPSPDGAYHLELRYWKLPAQLVNDSDTPTIPDTYQRLLWYWAVKECYAAEDDSQTAQYWEQQFNTLLSEFSADVKFPGSDQPSQMRSMWDDGVSVGWGG